MNNTVGTEGSVLNYMGYWIREGQTLGHFNVGTGCKYWITEVIDLESIVLDMIYCTTQIYCIKIIVMFNVGMSTLGPLHTQAKSCNMKFW